MDTCIPSNFPFEQFNEIRLSAEEFAITKGLCVRSNVHRDDLQVVPICLFPSPFQRDLFNAAKSIQCTINKLMHSIAYDNAFLTDALEGTIKVDEFTKNLYQTHLKVLKHGRSQDCSLGLLRSDYMVDEEANYLRQIEVNAISVSFAGLSSLVTKYHRYILSKFNPGLLSPDVDNLPISDSDKKLANGLVEAWKHYGDSSAIILIVTEPFTVNICDQKRIEIAVYKQNPAITVLRRSFDELPDITKLNENAELIVDQRKVAVVYFRTAYTPDQYSDRLWDLRFMIECSKAIKCPSIHYQLAGVKKIQQLLTDEKLLSRFLNETEVKQVSATFAKIWGFDDAKTRDQVVQLAMNTPEKFVLKPQREGGGNNFYGDDIVKQLKPIVNTPALDAYILMEYVKPKPVKNFIIRSKETQISNTPNQIVSELGIFGSILGDKENIYLNTEAGHVLRSKAITENEGGICSGAGALDSVYLFN